MYQALYRKYRPQKFNELVGQDHIKITITNALKHQRFTHAYMFTGPRGTGKTTSAKLLSKAVNCMHLNEQGEPCNTCENCISINNGSHPDVLEIDAASNNGVEQIRDIREQVNYSPTQARIKVYIIDEVHMLSIGAFNALLKTLEEPPKHVMFILATTDIHKVPVTIISRCQRYDFRRIGQQYIMNRLQYVAEKEGLNFKKDALQVISMLSQGGLRDALSLMDQSIAFATGESITKDDVAEVVGKVSIDKIETCIEYLLNGETIKVLNMINQIILNGKEPGYVLEDLIGYLRDMCLSKAFNNNEDNITTAIPNERFKRLIELSDVNHMQQMIKKLTEIKKEMKASNHAQITLEVGLIQLSSTEQTERTLITKVKQLEKRIEALQGKNNISQEQSMVRPIDNKIDITDMDKNSLNSSLEQVSCIATEEFVINKVYPGATKEWKVRYQEHVFHALQQLNQNHRELVQLVKEVNVLIASHSAVIIGASEYEIQVLGQDHIYKELCQILQSDTTRFLEVKFMLPEKWNVASKQIINIIKKKKINS
ncbi:DNA polymerase III subunit gamma/tau [Bacillus cereus]|uniref:DNA polymerase III subunit gamma/tau n=1 Tax=Bacillus cereus group TaxID=86661 RepID=UPI003014AA1B